MNIKKYVILIICSLALSLFYKNSLAAEHLDKLSAAIIPIAAHTATGNTEELKNSLENGLTSGLSINDIKEVLIQMYAYCGFPRSLNGLSTFMAVLESRKKQGIEDLQGDFPVKLPVDANRNKIGSDIQTALLGTPQMLQSTSSLQTLINS